MVRHLYSPRGLRPTKHNHNRFSGQPVEKSWQGGNYAIKINNSLELRGTARIGDMLTFCYVPATCTVLPGRTHRIIPSFRRNIKGKDDATVRVQLWEYCHRPGGAAEHMDWSDCSLLGMIVCEKESWCM